MLREDIRKRMEKAKTLREDGTDESICFQYSTNIYPRPSVAHMALSLAGPSEGTMSLTVTAITKSIVEAVPCYDERRES